MMMERIACSITAGLGRVEVMARLRSAMSAAAITTTWKATPPSRLLTARSALPPSAAVPEVATSGNEVTRPSNITPTTAPLIPVRPAMVTA